MLALFLFVACAQKEPANDAKYDSSITKVL